MHSRALVGGSLVAGITGTLAFMACGEPQRPQLPPTMGSADPPTAAVAPFAPAASASAPASSPASPAADPLDVAARAASRCEQPEARILNQPDGGVVFNNAMTSADAGFIDRTEASLMALAAKASAFRCCLSAWVSAHEGEHQAMLQLQLAPDGHVLEARVDASRTTFQDPTALRCLILVAREAAFPPSPTSKTTWLEYPIRASAAR